MVFGALHHTITHFFLDFLLATDQTYELGFFILIQIFSDEVSYAPITVYISTLIVNCFDKDSFQKFNSPSLFNLGITLNKIQQSLYFTEKSHIMSSAWDNNHGQNSYTNGNKTEENHRWKPKTSKSNGCDEDHDDKEEKNVSLYGLCFGHDPEKDIAEQSKVILNMIYFFQVLPFYILQFTSGMALGIENMTGISWLN